MSPAAFIDDPAWVEIFPEFRDSASKRHLPSHEDSSPISPEEAERHLKPGGTLGMMAGYEERPGQIDMLRAVAEAFNAREHLMIEAGTGVGKSLAYLIPSIVWAATNDTPVVISTATRNLQSQLIGSDIPRAVSVLGEEARNFKVALLKGRSNYLCIRALAEFFAPGYWTMSPEEQAEMPRLIEWLKSTKDGDLDFYDGLPRSLVSCPGEECSARRCPYYSRCFVFRARRTAAKAHLVVANHALVLAESANGMGSVLPAYGRLVLDEAHNLESIATEYLSREFSEEALMRIFSRLVRSKSGRRRGGSSGALASLERQMQKGVLSGSHVREAVMRAMGAIHGVTVRVLDASRRLLRYSERLMRPLKAQVVRFRVEETVRKYCVRGLYRDYEEDLWSEAEFFGLVSRLESELAAAVKLLHELRDAIDGSVPAGEINPLGDLSAQFSSIAESLVDFANDADFIFSASSPEHAYWIEHADGEGRRKAARLVAAPLSVADALHKILYDVKDSVILSSATLRVGNDFGYIARRLGCRERFRAMTAVSPFDYLRQACVLALDSLPDPSVDAEAYARQLPGLFAELFGATRSRALVLFTSYEMMNAVAEKSRALLEEAGMELLVQGEGMSRETMTRRLAGASAGSRGVVLFGAHSFWEGVDVAGEALSCVVIARLPFAQVGDPIVEARSEKITHDGGSAFRDYTLPEAVIKFRQGFGRLIRSKRDSGVVVVTDPRIVTKSYGAIFRRSIPAAVHTVTDKDELVSRVADFFAS